jgi:hypothetical protein
MMGWFDRWFMKKVRWSIENEQVMYNRKEAASLSRGLVRATDGDETGVDWSEGLNIQVKRVNGGFIVNFRKWDKVKDQHHANIHIITDEMDFNQELCKLITMESMR